MISLPRKYVLRVYDLKGSNYDREVLKPDDAITTSIVKTLKDRDFEKLEERVNILVNYSERVKLQLFKDVSFLTKHRLIDYSLLIIKADWDSYSDTLGGSKNFG
jgi:1-phosphatidylinositol-4-phosphate 5-kinase